MKRRIVVASTNKGKIAEFSAMLGGDIEWLSLGDFEGINEVVEDGLTFAENARKKAMGYAAATGCWAVADDSGLVVDAIGGDPGIHSARFSGPKIDGEERGLIDHRNIEKVLELMKGVAAEKRTARFMCCLCLASPEKVLAETEGKCEGVIMEKETGTNGFGYDPIFFAAKLDKTLGEASGEEKNKISHRGNAIRSLQPTLKQLPLLTDD